MTELFAPVCSVMLTKRRRFFWAAWWSGPPTRVPFKKPDASDGGAATREEAIAAAERAAGRTLVAIESEWARAWMRTLRGQPAWTETTRHPKPRVATERAAAPNAGASIWEVLGVHADVTAEELKLAFRNRARETHPDQGGSAEEFRRVMRAYEEAGRRLRRPKRKTR